MLRWFFCVVGMLGAGFVSAAPPEQGVITRSDTCGSCHRDIFTMWRASAHASSMEDPVFLESFRKSQAALGADRSRACLNCHAPAVQMNGDWELQERITWEGVSCDVCHSLVSVDMSGQGPRMSLDPGPVKRGPIRDADPLWHEVAYSELHESVLVCAPCHEYVNEAGTPIMTTFSEWRESGARQRGDICQTCHMGLTKANVVEPRVKRVAHAEVNLHEVPGGHSLDQLYKALAVDFEMTREADELSVDVRLTNKGAGHGVPTGMPDRRIILIVAVDGGDPDHLEDRRIYAKSFADASGEMINQTWGYFERGATLVSDTRIMPDQQRAERFRFAVPATATVHLTVRLKYEQMTGDSEGTSFTFYSERRMLRPKSG